MTKTVIDHYQVLNLRRDAGAESIHQAYRTLARVYHPDVNPGPDAAANMARVNEAYACLGDPSRRVIYDQSLKVSEPVPLQEAVLAAARTQLTAEGWRCVEIGPDDAVLECEGSRVLLRLVTTLDSADLDSWTRASREGLRRGLADSAVVVAYRILVADRVPRAPLGGRMPATAVDLVEARAMGCPFADSRVEDLFKPLLVD